MAAHLSLPVERLSDAARFAEDLELDSFKMLTLPIALEVDWSIEFENDPNIFRRRTIDRRRRSASISANKRGDPIHKTAASP
jgi:hypothetical protein